MGHYLFACHYFLRKITLIQLCETYLRIIYFIWINNLSYSLHFNHQYDNILTQYKTDFSVLPNHLTCWNYILILIFFFFLKWKSINCTSNVLTKVYKNTPPIRFFLKFNFYFFFQLIIFFGVKDIFVTYSVQRCVTGGVGKGK